MTIQSKIKKFALCVSILAPISIALLSAPTAQAKSESEAHEQFHLTAQFVDKLNPKTEYAFYMSGLAGQLMTAKNTETHDYIAAQSTQPDGHIQATIKQYETGAMIEATVGALMSVTYKYSVCSVKEMKSIQDSDSGLGVQSPNITCRVGEGTTNLEHNMPVTVVTDDSGFKFILGLYRPLSKPLPFKG